MGSGKSTVGRLSAEALNMGFIDTDENIVRKTGLSISRIFEQEGEEGFRELEREEIKAFSGRDRFVVATGGGVVLDPGNMRLLRRNGIVINLRASVEILAERLKGKDDRPLLTGDDLREKLRTHSEGRSRFYLNRDFAIDTDSVSLENVVKMVSSIALRPHIRMCVSVSGDKPKEQVATATESGATMVELRFDLMEEPDIQALVRTSGLPVIATDRKDKDNLRTAVEEGCDFVDIEWDSPERGDITSLARKHGVRVIASVHDFEGTPETVPEKGDADYLKIAAKVKSKADLKRLVARLDGRDDLIVVGMGELGVPSRIVAPLRGSYLTYCTVAEATAPGQLTLESMLEAYRRMGFR